MTANNGWPGKPGVPFNPEKDGWHWVENKFTGDRRAALWLTDLHWGLRVPTHEMAEACIYLGPVLTPEEEAALQKRCEEAERERDALRRDASQEIATDELVRRLQHLGDWQAADRIEVMQKRVAELRQIIRYVAGCEHATASDEDLLEQVAAAICRMSGIGPTDHISIDGSPFDWAWKHFLPQAIAALTGGVE